MNRKQILDELYKRKAVAVLRVKDPKKLVPVIDAIYAGGISVMEITMTVPNAIEMIRSYTSNMTNDVIVGVGTAMNAADAEAAIEAGAKFVVSPVFKKEIVDTAHKHDVPAMPGCFTPTEVFTAYEYGADIIKVFPADVLGMPFFKGILAPMPYLKIMPTGGVTLDNAGDWLKIGACAVGIGAALTDQKAIDAENYQLLTENAKRIMSSITAFENLKKGL